MGLNQDFLSASLSRTLMENLEWCLAAGNPGRKSVLNCAGRFGAASLYRAVMDEQVLSLPVELQCRSWQTVPLYSQNGGLWAICLCLVAMGGDLPPSRVIKHQWRIWQRDSFSAESLNVLQRKPNQA